MITTSCCCMMWWQMVFSHGGEAGAIGNQAANLACMGHPSSWSWAVDGELRAIQAQSYPGHRVIDGCPDDAKQALHLHEDQSPFWVRTLGAGPMAAVLQGGTHQSFGA
ncbi:hypothetical protein B0J13DRAFT_262902 [Dactylonectria estremocensis]|uniref:Uncharacterized protein n=1 Tax=Dactylonectria estremocensis TaxID=1079267 RepID=A0A9P9F552_9HYPO|nr:hypothetical protein B0J13DRAFT_262902 [Dactylonectria estremocensis]